MSIQDLRITEIMYNPTPGAYQFIEVTNTGDTAVSSRDFFVGNSDFSPTYFEGTFGPDIMIPAGAAIVLVPVLPDFSAEVFEPPVPITQAEFEAAYGPLPTGAVFLSYPAFLAPVEGDLLGGDRSYTIGGDDVAADSVFIENGAAEGQSVLVSNASGETVTEFGDPTPGAIDGVAPPVVIEIIGGDGSDDLDDTTGDDIMDGGRGADVINGRGGDDIINGGSQNDTIKGGDGNDDIFGGVSNDVLNGNDGADVLDGWQRQRHPARR